jgi:hypothetical protein
VNHEYAIGASTITLHGGRIVESRSEVLESSDDAWLSMGGGVSQALSARPAARSEP